MPTKEITDEVSDDIMIEWLFDRRIVAYNIRTLTRASLQQWSEMVYECIEGWPDDQPYLALHDLSFRGVIMPYVTVFGKKALNIAVYPDAEERITALCRSKPNFRAKVALVISDQLSGHIGNIFAQNEMLATPKINVKYNVFTSREAALEWLQDS